MEEIGEINWSQAMEIMQALLCWIKGAYGIQVKQNHWNSYLDDVGHKNKCFMTWQSGFAPPWISLQLCGI
jgi:hypothetical protein